MLGQGQKQIMVKTTLAVVASTALSTVLLLGYPLIFFLIFFFLVFVSGGVATDYLNITTPISYILSGFIVFLAGVILNVFLIQKFSLLHKIISIVLYVLLTAGIAVLLSGYIQYQLSHAFI